MFGHPTIAEVAKVADTATAIQAEQKPVTGLVPLTPIQHFLFEQNISDSYPWNLIWLLQVRQKVDASLLEKAFQYLLLYHDALRLRFERKESIWQQYNASPGDAIAFSLIDLSQVAECDRASAITTTATELLASLNLSKEPSIRVALFDLGSQNSDRLLIVAHHLIVDAVSMRFLVEDLQTVYQQLSCDRPIQLPPKTTSYQEWSKQLTEYAQSNEIQQELSYWLETLPEQANSLPRDYPGGINTEYSARTISRFLDPKETHVLLREFPNRGTLAQEVLLTSLLCATSQWTRKNSLLVNFLGHGREEILENVDVSRTVGWFTTIYPTFLDMGNVVASPCALMAAIMPTLLSGIANGARNGILFKSGAQLEIMGQVRAIAFDKTGTLTTGKPQVVKIMAATLQTESKLLEIAAVESLSEHPIGEAIVQAAQTKQLKLPQAVNVQAYTGQGIVGEVDRLEAAVGKAAFLQARVKHLPEQLMQLSREWEEEGKTVVWVAYAGEVLGLIAVADTVRLGAAVAIAKLKKLGIEEIVMLTGDNQRTADSIAKEIGVDRVYAELLPSDKVNVIRQLRQKYQTVAMVGDGINDAPALAVASVGIAMGTTGSDVALETADVVLMADKLERLEQAIRLGRRSQSIVKQNIGFAVFSVFLLLIANFTGYITLPNGVIGHEGSTVLVTLSGLRNLVQHSCYPN